MTGRDGSGPRTCRTGPSRWSPTRWAAGRSDRLTGGRASGVRRPVDHHGRPLVGARPGGHGVVLVLRQTGPGVVALAGLRLVPESTGRRQRPATRGASSVRSTAPTSATGCPPGSHASRVRRARRRRRVLRALARGGADGRAVLVLDRFRTRGVPPGRLSSSPDVAEVADVSGFRGGAETHRATRVTMQLEPILRSDIWERAERDPARACSPRSTGCRSWPPRSVAPPPPRTATPVREPARHHRRPGGSRSSTSGSSPHCRWASTTQLLVSETMIGQLPASAGTDRGRRSSGLHRRQRARPGRRPAARCRSGLSTSSTCSRRHRRPSWPRSRRP